VHAGVTVERVRDETSLDFLVAGRVATTEPPAPEELAILRALDPERRFIG